MLWLLGGYMWLFIHRPFEVWPMLGVYRLERVYMLAIITAWLAHAGKGWVANRLNVAFFSLLAAIILSWLGSSYLDLGTKTVQDMLKVAVFYVLAVSTVRNEQDLRRLVAAYLIAVGLYMSHSLLEYTNGRHAWRMGVNRMIGVDQTFGDPNTFSATLVYSVGLVVPFWLDRSRAMVRLLTLGYVGLTVVCIMLTGSRTALVGLACVALLIILSLEQRAKLLLVLVLLSPVIWIMTPGELQERFLTLIDSSRGPANALQSANSRMMLFRQGVSLWGEEPATGHGPGTFAYVSGTGKEAHNLYGQTLAELGALGGLALLAVVLAFWKNAREVVYTHLTSPMLPKGFSYHLTITISLMVVVLLVMGWGGHNLYRYTWMWFGAFQAIAVHCIRKNQQRLWNDPRAYFWA